MGEAFRLTPKDLTFGSHRSHGEILAKGLRSIEIMEEGELLSVDVYKRQEDTTVWQSNI